MKFWKPGGPITMAELDAIRNIANKTRDTKLKFPDDTAARINYLMWDRWAEQAVLQWISQGCAEVPT